MIEQEKRLEEAFFMKEDMRLLEQMREKKAHAEKAKQLQQATGIHDSDLLERLLDHGVEAHTLAALLLVPLVRVAWADGSVDDKERNAVMQAAKDAGIVVGSPGHVMLEKWLTRGPATGLVSAWSAYAHTLGSQVKGDERKALVQSISDKAQSVAEASGGLLGIGNKVSKEEQQMLIEIRKAFD